MSARSWIRGVLESFIRALPRSATEPAAQEPLKEEPSSVCERLYTIGELLEIARNPNRPQWIRLRCAVDALAPSGSCRIERAGGEVRVTCRTTEVADALRAVLESMGLRVPVVGPDSAIDYSGGAVVGGS